MGLSIRAYARHRGVSHAAVRKAIATGRISVDADGAIDPAKADAEWVANTGLRRGARKKATAQTQERARPTGKTASGAAVASVRETLREQGLPHGPRVSYVEARTAHEIAKAHLARLRLQERRREIVDRAKANAHVFRLAREERDAWLNWPARVSALMAAELGVDPHKMHVTLERHVREHLIELAEIRPRLD